MSNPQHEPTMEEILASIRKIISEDSSEPAAAPAQEAASEVVSAPAVPAPSSQPQAVYHEDVLELTQEVEAPHAAAAPAPASIPAPAPVEDIVFENIAPAANEHSDIFSDHTRKAVEDTFNAIPDEEPEPRPVAHSAPIMAPLDGSTVENVFERAVRESFEPVLRKYLADNSSAVINGMKPLIREWMDEHFPALLEGAVRAEVERVVKARAVKR
jgi:cell pole-organizing protein PopZ